MLSGSLGAASPSAGALVTAPIPAKYREMVSPSCAGFDSDTTEKSGRSAAAIPMPPTGLLVKAPTEVPPVNAVTILEFVPLLTTWIWATDSGVVIYGTITEIWVGLT